MKVVNNVRVQLVTLLILSISFGYYATAAAEQQQELQDTEVNGAQKSSHKIRFGTKIAKIKSLPAEQPTAIAAPTRPTTNQRSATNNPQTASNVPTLNAPRISRRFDYRQEASPSAQLIAQPEIPRANKKDVDANVNSSHRVQLQRSRGSIRHRSESIHSATSTQLQEANSATTQTQTQRRNSTPRSRVVDFATSNISSRTLGSDPANSLTQGKKSRAPLSGDSARVKKSTTTTTTQQSLFSRNFQQNNPFNFFSQNFWSLSAPPTTKATPTTTTTTSTKKPPKKYKHAVVTPTPFDDKFNFQKLQSIKTTEKPNVPRRQNNDGPFRIALPTINFLNPPASTASSKRDSEKEKEKRNTAQPLRERFVCPRESEVRFQLFPKICKTDKDCSIWNRDELCCEIFGSKSCVTGMPKPLEETSHMPILGLIPRKCPTRPLAELWWDVKECSTDNDCWPRVCCPDGRRRYCRTSEPELEVVPVPVKRSFNYLTEYLECTPPPPPIFDLHPRACTSTFDCFPNVCCQEAGLRHCRPPKKSLLTLMANFLNVDFVKRLTQNIVIK